MSASIARRPNIVLRGSARLSPDFSKLERVNVIAGGGNWQDQTARLAAQCSPQYFETCGCKKGSCACGMSQPSGSPSSTTMGQGQQNGKQTPMDRLNDDCRRGRWVPITVNNNALVGAGGTGTVTFQPQAPFKLARMTLSAAQAADFTGITIGVGPTQNILPGAVDGTYFSVASNQDGDGRVDAPICAVGQTITVNFTSTAGVAAGAARFTLQGAYAGQLDPHY